MIVLIGHRGSGKSTLGKALAEHLQVPFQDTDQLVEQAIGMSVAECFSQRGEAEFRRLESEALDRALMVDGVIAVGGGTCDSERNRAKLKGFTIVHVTVDALTRSQRLLSGNRPAVSEAGREDVFQSLATMSVDACRPIEDIVLDLKQ